MLSFEDTGIWDRECSENDSTKQLNVVGKFLVDKAKFVTTNEVLGVQMGECRRQVQM